VGDGWGGRNLRDRVPADNGAVVLRLSSARRRVACVEVIDAFRQILREVRKSKYPVASAVGPTRSVSPHCLDSRAAQRAVRNGVAGRAA